MRDGTRVVRAGLPRFAQGEPFLPGPTFANPYYLAGDPSSSSYSYGRIASQKSSFLRFGPGLSSKTTSSLINSGAGETHGLR